MKRLLNIIFFIPLFAGAQAHYFMMAGEYNSMIWDSTLGKSYHIYAGQLSENTSGSVANQKSVGCTSHNEFIINTSGQVYSNGQNNYGEGGPNNVGGSTSWALISLDTLGNAFNNVVKAQGGYYDAMFLKSDSTLWFLGDGYRGNCGNGVYYSAHHPVTKPLQVLIKSGSVKVLDFYCSSSGNFALGSDDSLYTWGSTNYYDSAFVIGRQGDVTTPTALALPSLVTWFSASGAPWTYVGLANGQIWGFGYKPDYSAHASLAGGVSGGTVGPTPTRMDDSLSLYIPGTIKKIVCSSNACYALSSTGQIFGWGDYNEGEPGAGVQYPYPYGFQTIHPFGEAGWPYIKLRPFDIAPGKTDWTDIFTTASLVYWAWLRDASGDIYFAGGRAKTGESLINVTAANPTNGNISGAWPDAWNIVWPTRSTDSTHFLPRQSISPSPLQVTADTCILNNTTAACVPGIYTPPTGAAPTLTVNNQSITGTTATLFATVAGGAKSGGGNLGIQYTDWTLVSGPNTPKMPIKRVGAWYTTHPNVTLSILVPGTYTFSATTYDEIWQTTTQTMTLTVSSNNCGNGCIYRSKFHN